MSYELKKVFASLPQMERGVSKTLGGDPKGNNFLYTNGKSVIIRNIDNPAIADIYTEHPHQVTVAKYSPSGFYIASADISGKIRIWDTTQKEHLLKYEYQPFSGKVKDIAWTEDSKRIAMVGEGREKFGAVFLWDTGSSVGEISGHNKIINSVDIKQTRPYRLVTGSDDNCSAFFEGPPFKFKFTMSDHSRFVNCVRFSPDGSRFASAGADGQIFLYDGKTGEKTGALGGAKAHDGGVYAVSVQRGLLGALQAAAECSQNSIVMLQGHSKPIQSLTAHRNEGRPYIYSGSHDGHINYWDAETGDNDGFSGKGHSNLVAKMVVNKDGQLVTCSMDDTVRFTDLRRKEYSASDLLKMDFQPKCIAVGPGGYALAVCIGQLVLMKDKKKCFTLENLGFEPESAALHPGGGTAAVGGADGMVHLFSIQGNTLKDDGKTMEAKGPVTDMAYSNDGAFLAVADEKKVITVFSVADGYAVKNDFYGHHAKVVCLAWSPDNEHFASGGMDMLVYLWAVSDPDRRVKIPDAHRLHHVSGLAWLDEHTLVTVSHDASVKQWTVKF
nr:WD repeat-containing protein 1 [Paramormyrops kingsleyae]